jgi:hypothetical protein
MDLPFLNHGTTRGEKSAPHPGRTLPPGKTRYPLYRMLGGPQGRSVQVRKISPTRGFDPRTVQPLAIISIMFKIYGKKAKKKFAYYSMLSYHIFFQDPIEQCFSNWVPLNSGVREMRMSIFVNEKKASRIVHDFSSTAIIPVLSTINGADPSGRRILRSSCAPCRLLRS